MSDHDPFAEPDDTERTVIKPLKFIYGVAVNTYKRHRFPPEIISYVVWIYFRLSLRHRDVEDLSAQ